MVAPESCPDCRFDGAHYDLRDALGTLRATPPMWLQSVERVADTVLALRPTPGSWSAAERAAHSADVIGAVERRLHQVLTEDAPVLAPLSDERAPDASDGFDAAFDRLEDRVQRLHDRAAAGGNDSDPQWKRRGQLGDQIVDAAWLLRHAIHDTTHQLHAVGRGLHQLGAGAPTQVGAVAQINVSQGGVPKTSIGSAEVGWRGLVGDRQTARQHHGKPMQALCLWSAEVIEALQDEGHPIGAGFAGENMTLSGIDWSTIRPGVQLRIGEVHAEISAWAAPCKKNAAWFLGRDFNRMSHDLHPGWSRAYAWVREPGIVATHDEVIVEPRGASAGLARGHGTSDR
ncbi:MAG: MOSC domain-containing protein [Acidimicrobiales bacterium]